MLSQQPGFTPEDKSTFAYWFAHWCAFQMTALNLRRWKLKYLLHDAEKPWLKLIMPYEKVRILHRRNNAHHLAYKHLDKIDWEALVIDWECSRFTKQDAQLNALQTYEAYVKRTDKYSPELIAAMKANIPPVLKKFGLLKETA